MESINNGPLNSSREVTLNLGTGDVEPSETDPIQNVYYNNDSKMNNNQNTNNGCNGVESITIIENVYYE